LCVAAIPSNGNTEARQSEGEGTDFLVLGVEVAVVQRLESVLEGIDLVFVLEDLSEALEAEEVTRRETKDEAGVLRAKSPSATGKSVLKRNLSTHFGNLHHLHVILVHVQYDQNTERLNGAGSMNRLKGRRASGKNERKGRKRKRTSSSHRCKERGTKKETSAKGRERRRRKTHLELSLPTRQDQNLTVVGNLVLEATGHV
jgi:hypothetical protein